MKRLIFILIGLLVGFFASLPSFAETIAEDMVSIKGGCFMMGTDKVFYYEWGRENERERPAHKVCVSDFYLDKYEVTQEKWQAVRDYNNSPVKGPKIPVSRITWAEANQFCRDRGQRLPTEAEWEYAARAGSQADNPWGDGIDYDYLWFAGNSFRQHSPVGKKKPNAWGVYDMMGSVWEWVADWYSDNYYQSSPVQNPKGPETRQSWRVIRGASWVDEEEVIRVTVRYRGMADPTDDFWVGFRCASTTKDKSK